MLLSLQVNGQELDFSANREGSTSDDFFQTPSDYNINPENTTTRNDQPIADFSLKESLLDNKDGGE